MSNPKLDPVKKPASFQRSLTQWYQEVAKDYPWRRTTDPWAILVSEIMLQQTQVATVLNKNFFTDFLEKFPTPQVISVASEQEILSAWEGLGYYLRVRNLQKAAIAICENHDGIFPTGHAEILELPGIGRYTAGAIASFAYNDPQPIVDANVARIFSRVFDYQKRVDSTTGIKQLWAWAEALLPNTNPRPYNSALMELGQQVCTNKTPKCNQCVIQKFCRTKTPENLPIKKAAKKTVLVDEFALFSICSDKGLLLQQEARVDRRAGMWKLPLREHIQTEQLPLLSKSSYGITHHKVTLRVYLCQPNHKLTKSSTPKEKEIWHPLSELPNLPMPSPFRKILSELLKDYL